MSENMIERVAIAISGAPFPSKASLTKAKKAIEAMREPTENMFVEGDVEILSYLNDGRLVSYNSTPAIDCWKSMIDAALKS